MVNIVFKAMTNTLLSSWSEWLNSANMATIDGLGAKDGSIVAEKVLDLFEEFLGTIWEQDESSVPFFCLQVWEMMLDLQLNHWAGNEGKTVLKEEIMSRFLSAFQLTHKWNYVDGTYRNQEERAKLTPAAREFERITAKGVRLYHGGPFHPGDKFSEIENDMASNEVPQGDAGQKKDDIKERFIQSTLPLQLNTICRRTFDEMRGVGGGIKRRVKGHAKQVEEEEMLRELFGPERANIWASTEELDDNTFAQHLGQLALLKKVATVDRDFDQKAIQALLRIKSESPKMTAQEMKERDEAAADNDQQMENMSDSENEDSEDEDGVMVVENVVGTAAEVMTHDLARRAKLIERLKKIKRWPLSVYAKVNWEEAAKEGLTAAFGRFNDRKDYTMERKRWCLEAQQRAQERKQQQELLAMDTVDVNENNAIVEPDYFKFFQNDQKKTWF